MGLGTEVVWWRRLLSGLADKIVSRLKEIPEESKRCVDVIQKCKEHHLQDSDFRIGIPVRHNSFQNDLDQLDQQTAINSLSAQLQATPSFVTLPPQGGGMQPYRYGPNPAYVALQGQIKVGRRSLLRCRQHIRKQLERPFSINKF
jgi:hypothetical protein